MGFCHLHVHTEYSMLDGHARIKNLVAKAKQQGHTALAITDHGWMHGVQGFYFTCKDNGIKPILGVELYTAPTSIHEKTRELRQSGHIVLLAKNQQGYKNIIKLASIAATDGMYFKPRVDMELLHKHHEGVVCLSACLQGDIPRLILARKWEEAKELAAQYKEIFGDDFYIELQFHGLEDQKFVLPRLIMLAKELGIKTVATNDVHYVEKTDAFAQRVLMCMNTDTTVDNPEALGYGNPDEWYFKSEEEMRAIFDGFDADAVSNTMEIVEKCNVELDVGSYKLPAFPCPEKWKSSEGYFRALCNAGLKKRYGYEYTTHQARLQEEMDIITSMGFVDYFLIVFDIIAFAKTNGIPIGPGRGSAAGSIVAYCLGITDICPVKYGLLFERFLNPERINMPDVDIDIDPDGREMVIDHIIEMYGADHVSQIITFDTMAARSSVTRVGKALGMDNTLIQRALKLIPTTVKSIQEALSLRKDLEKLYKEDANVKQLLDISMSVEGLPHHTSTHAAAIVIAPNPLTESIPVTRGKDGTTILVSQFDMSSVEQAGLLKVDLLGLKTLTILKEAENAIQTKGTDANTFSLSSIRLDDPKVYAMLSKGQTSGVFQLESDGMRDTLRKIKPTCLEDLIAAVALFRPGPMDSISDFARNKHNPQNVSYLHPALEPILRETYSQIVYQEQVMAIVRKLAGYSYGRADLVRRAMAKKKADKMAQERDIFIHGNEDVDGCVRRGIPEETANKLWDSMADFASYAFNKSHAACYAVLAYRTAFLRYYFPAEFMAARLTSALGDSKKLRKLLNDCEQQGIKVLPPDINVSSGGFTVENGGIRFGLMAIKDCGKAIVAELAMERAKGPFKDLQDLIERTINSASVDTMEALIKSGSLDAFPHSRAEMLAVLQAMIKSANKMRKEYTAEQVSMEEAFFGACEDAKEFHFPRVEFPKDIPPLTLREKLDMELASCGIYVSGHPMSEYKKAVANKTTHQIGQFSEDGTVFESGTQVRVAGVVKTKRDHTTRKGDQMAFLTMEDQTGSVDVTVFPRAYASYHASLVEGNAILIYGKVETDEYGVKIVADSISKLEPDSTGS